MKLKNGLRVLWRSDSEAQVGDDPRIARLVRLNHPREFALLRLLESDQTPAQLRRSMAALGGKRDRADELLRELLDANLVDTEPRTRSPELRLPAASRDLLAAEADARSLIEGDGWPVMAERGRQEVSIYGLGRTGAHVAISLAAAGVGRLRLMDSRPVTARDCGQIFRRQHVGEARGDVLKRVIVEAGFACQASTRPSQGNLDVAVMVDYEVSDPNRCAFLSSHAIAHLSVVVGEASITCGPWVPRAGGPCLHCQHLWAVDADPRWPAVATQRLARSAIAARGEDPSLAGVVGGLAAADVLRGLTGAAPTTAGRCVQMSLPTYELTWTKLRVHPKCHQHEPWSGPADPPKPPPLMPLPPGA